MARTSKLELTWQSYRNYKGGRWCKIIEGKRHYFGTATKKSDTHAYRKALAAYRIEQDVRDRRNLTAHLREQAVHTLTSGNGGLGFGITDPDELAAILGLPSKYTVVEHEQQRLDTLRSHPTVAKAIDNSITQETTPTAIADLLKMFLDAQAERRQRTVNDPSVPKKEQLSQAGLRNYQNSARVIRQTFEQAKVKTLDPVEIERGLLAMKADLDAKVKAGDIKPSYANNLTRAVRPLFNMAWKRRLIGEMPRVIDELVAKPQTTSTAAPLNKATVKKLWAKADPHMRACMAIALNCGLYSVDIARVTDDNLIGTTHLAARRAKTGAPGRWKLWPITRKLIKATRQDGPGQPFLWVTGKGRSMHISTGRTNSDYLARELRKLAKTAGVKATWAQFRDTGAAFIEKWAGQHGDDRITSMFLAHSDQRQAGAYLEKDPAKLDTGQLDKATSEFGKYLNLTQSGAKS